MREIRLSGSEEGGTGNSTGPPYPYPQVPAISVGTGMMARPMPQNIAKTPDFPVGAGHAREHAESAGCFGGGGHACEQTGNV